MIYLKVLLISLFCLGDSYWNIRFWKCFCMTRYWNTTPLQLVCQWNKCPPKLAKKAILVILQVVMYIALKDILSRKSSLMLQKAFSCLLSLLHLSIIGELKSQIVNQRLQFLPPSIIIATYHNLQTSLFEPAEGNLYFLRVPSGWLTQAKNINAGYICLLQSSHVSKKHSNLSQD